jgi:hypothetical protein
MLLATLVSPSYAIDGCFLQGWSAYLPRNFEKFYNKRSLPFYEKTPFTIDFHNGRLQVRATLTIADTRRSRVVSKPSPRRSAFRTPKRPIKNKNN